LDGAEAREREEFSNALSLVVTDFNREQTARFQVARSMFEQSTNEREAIRAAVKSDAWFERFDIDLQLINLRGRNVRRIRCNERVLLLGAEGLK
jgi:hypothetical protein